MVQWYQCFGAPTSGTGTSARAGKSSAGTLEHWRVGPMRRSWWMKQYPSPNTSTHARDVAKQERRHALLLLAYLRGRPYSSQERDTRVQWVPVPGLPPSIQRCVWHNRPSLERLAYLAAEVMGGEPMHYVGDLAEWLREQ